MTIWTALEPASTTVDPGSSTTVRLRLRNTGDVVDEYRFETVGEVAPYVTVEPPSVRLFPGTTGVVELTFAPPRTPDSAAGPHPFGVRVMPTEHPEATTVAEGNVTFTPFMEVRAELVPHTVKGRFKGRPRLAVDNLGNTKLTASISGGDTGDELSYEIVPSNVQIEPGRAAFVDATLKPKQITWAGQKQQRPYELAVRRSGTEPLPVNGTYEQRSVLPYWLMTALSLILALTIAGVVLWFAYKPQVRSVAQEVAQKPVSSALPEAPAPKPSVKLPEDDTPAEQPKTDDGDKEEKEEEKGGGGEPKEEKTGGPLPITSEDKPNLFVQFAQVRLAKGASDCKLTGDYTVGKLDPATQAALECFQKSNDKKYGTFSALEKTDGLGNLGRTTMTALLSAHFVGKESLPLTKGEEDPEVPWVRNILVWGTQAEIDQGDLATTVPLTKANIEYLRGGPVLKQPVTDSLAGWIKLYQSQTDTEQTGVLDGITLNQMKAGWTKELDNPGSVTAEDWLPAPME
ncbi:MULTISPECIES: hypothetical protein [unclassified Streptomyces]|uniref:COG1470 family protein n=1 Tax=unclassified Streptomyces TaxID=2593676 RepID=UPI002E786EC0|nr:hypothetical protein [Streptomyces sp. JV176]MEE1799953.1 hypothetical protein [Streptomyces sp. JV176]